MVRVKSRPQCFPSPTEPEGGTLPTKEGEDVTHSSTRAVATHTATRLPRLDKPTSSMEVEPPLHPPPGEEPPSPQLTASEAAASPSSGYLAEDPASPADDKPEALLLPPPQQHNEAMAAMFAALSASRMGLTGLGPAGLLPGGQAKMEVKPEPGMPGADSPVSSQTNEKTEAGKDRSRRFFCQYCNKGFSLMNVLKVHERIHTGEKPYVCDICHKAFNQSGSLNRHKNTHLRRMEGNRTNKCRFCDKQFLYSSQLQDHEATSHRQELSAVKTPPTPSGLAAPSLSNNLVVQALATMGGGNGLSGMPSLAPSPVTSSAGQESAVMRALAIASAAKQAAEDESLSCKSCGKKFPSKEALLVHEQDHYVTNLTGHLINVMNAHPATQPMPGMPLMPQAVAALVSSPLSRFGLNGVGQSPPGQLNPSSALSILQHIHLSSMNPHGLSGPPKTPLGGLTGSVAPAGVSNDENRAVDSKARSLLTAVPPIPAPPTSAGGLDLGEGPLRLSPPVSLAGSGLGLPPLLGPLTLDVGGSGEQLRLGKDSITTSSGSSAGLPPPSINPMILSGHHLRCSMCDRHFENAAKLHLHMRSHETADGQKVCLECKKTFNCASALKIHYRRHSGERPYTCRYCRKSFSQNGTLKRHYTTCKEARNVQSRPPSDFIRHRSHLKTRNDNVGGSGGSLGAPSGDSSAESELSADGDVRKLMDIGPTPQPPKETVELVAQGFDMVDGPQDLSVMANATVSGNESDRPVNGDCSPAPGDAEMLPRSRKRKLDEPLPSSSRPASDLSPHIRDGLRDTESRPISQCSLHEIMRYLTMKNKLYRCEHCQIFFLDSALYYMHRSVHSQDAPLRCAICGYDATEKYNFHSHLMDHSKMVAVEERVEDGSDDEDLRAEATGGAGGFEDSVSSSNLPRAASQPTSE